MTMTVAPGPLAAIPAISLAELNARAALQTRLDRKYILPGPLVAPILAEIGGQARILEIDTTRLFAYESVYFDTPTLTSYLLAARARRRRFKVRTRSYLDSTQCWLEVKTRSARGSTVKHRLPYDPDDHERIAPGRQFVESTLAAESIPVGVGLCLAPTLVTRYRRSTLFLPASQSRVTIDTDLSWHTEDGVSLAMPGISIVETKTGHAASMVDKLLWSRGFRPARISKYATGLAAIRPDLPSTRWHRTLRRYFGPAGEPAG